MASKVLLVEDDNNLRDIYQARLLAEGYDIVAAKDGEEALVLAKKEQPDLIISDVMMPRVSGFEMLDILRNTEGMKDPKVIMLTALGQGDDKTRADQLGADRYLVKSQVTLEDIVKTAQELLGGVPAEAAIPVTSTVTEATVPTPPAPTEAAVDTTPVSTPLTPEPAVSPESEDANMPAPTTAGTAEVVTTPIEAAPSEAETTNDKLMADALKDLTGTATTNDTTTPTAPAVTTPTEPTATPTTTVPAEPVSTPAPSPAATTTSNDVAGGDAAPVAHKKVIQPLEMPVVTPQANINDLLAKEGEATTAPPVATPAPSTGDVGTNDQPGNVISPSGSDPAVAAPVPVDPPTTVIAPPPVPAEPVSTPPPASAPGSTTPPTGDPNAIAL
jgi:CheY-like chemotaxis protein